MPGLGGPVDGVTGGLARVGTRKSSPPQLSETPLPVTAVMWQDSVVTGPVWSPLAKYVWLVSVTWHGSRQARC